MSILNTLKEQLSCEPLSSATHIVVAYSGGVDSHVLLHALHQSKQEPQFNFQLSAIHIHHGLSQHADQWQTHCQQVCTQLNIEFQTANVSVDVLPRQSLEAQAREARYNKLVELAPANSQVMLGQHQDDQLETFLLQLKRGAGPKGLSAMNRAWVVHCPLQSSKKVGFYRPLLDTTQQLFWIMHSSIICNGVKTSPIKILILNVTFCAMMYCLFYKIVGLKLLVQWREVPHYVPNNKVY